MQYPYNLVIPSEQDHSLANDPHNEEPAFQRAAPLVACRRTLLYSARLKPCPSHSCSCRHDDRLQPCFQAVLFPFLLLPTPTTSSGPSFQSRALPVLALADNREP